MVNVPTVLPQRSTQHSHDDYDGWVTPYGGPKQDFMPDRIIGNAQIWAMGTARGTIHEATQVSILQGLDAVHYVTATEGVVQEGSSSGTDDLRRRLDRANRHFRRKAAAVLNDEAALRLLATMYTRVVVETDDFDFCEHGRALAKLTAANFCEISANSIYITKPGQRFIDNINKSES